MRELGGEYGERLELCAPDDPWVQDLRMLYRYEHIGVYGHPDPNPEGDGIQPGASLTVVGIDDQEVVAMGMATWSDGGQDATLRRMFTVWEHRRQGWARDVLRTIITELQQMPAMNRPKRLLLETGVQAVPALALYVSEGFVPVEPFGFYADAEGSVFLGKDL